MIRYLLISAALMTVSSVAMAQDAETIHRAAMIRDAALAENRALEIVTEITTRFGPRPAGSPAEQAAAAWAADWMRANGFENVRIEEFPLIGWDRGAESGALVGRFAQPLSVAALGHSPATPTDGIEAEVVRFTSLEELQAAPDGEIEGRIVYIDQGQMPARQNGSGYGPHSRIRFAGPAVAMGKGAVAFVMRSAGSDYDRLPHTGTTGYVEGEPTIPAFALAAPDADQLSRLVDMDEEAIRLRLFSSARTYETVSQNVMGDIVGDERPEEIIVLGSHLDSWDQGTGAIDDAAGGAITLAAALELVEDGRRPARTVRVILYGSEEVAQPTPETGGGGGVYVRGVGEAGAAEHVIAGESDFGADNIYELRLPPGAQGAAFQAAAAQALGPIGVAASETPETQGGADVGPLAQAGVPVFRLSQDGTRYFDLHHTANDTLDKIDPEQLSQNVAAWAGLIWLIADSEVTFRQAAE